MLLTRARIQGKLGEIHVRILVGAWWLLVTSCSTAPSIGGLAAAGGQPGQGGAGADDADQGDLRTAGSGGASVVARGGKGPGGRAGVQSNLPAPGSGDSGDSGGTTAAGGSVADEQKHYPGQGFIVHEWGTNTIVVGSNGSLQRGLHHEEEDLPAFVYDRIKAGTLLGSAPSPSVTIKMETPVTYFYSPTALSVKARVDFPKGVLTQWYPAVKEFRPALAAAESISFPGVPAVLSDPALDPSFPFASEMCRVKFGTVSGGFLDWGTVSVQARGAAPTKPPPAAPLEQFGWSYARAVDSNAIETPSGESERFLFYRGLGDFDLPVTVAENAGKVTFTNGYSEPVSQVFLLNVNQERGAFAVHSEGIAASATLTDTVPSLSGAPTVDEYAQQLSEAVTKALDATGLYHDEAVAMVNSWRRQWFRTPGVRALYLLPQSWTEQSIPLTLSPKPDATVRVMLIRVEVITKEQETADGAALASFDTNASLGTAYFSALGRFAEPRLRRALQLSPSTAGEKHLAQIASAKSTIMSGE
jgi:hypothetical protein